MSKQNLMKRLNLLPLQLTNKTSCFGKLGLPHLSCNITDYPDYIALYNHPQDYHKTEHTCVATYIYDNIFDGPDGLYNAIFYGDKKRLDFFKKRFDGVKCFISFEYSVCGDVPPYMNYHNMGRSREVAIWLTTECHASVIPNISYISEDKLEPTIEGLEDVSVIAFNTMGKIRRGEDRSLLERVIVYVVDHMPQLKAIIAFAATPDDSKVKDLFRYAIDRDIQLVIPENALRIRNRIHQERRRSR
ncbi:MAG: DUF4417 domain-containing protein [Clostridia bacterium]|nr:DUF4417 domain-containing protein [Clostridia bacterium]